MLFGNNQTIEMDYEAAVKVACIKPILSIGGLTIQDNFVWYVRMPKAIEKKHTNEYDDGENSIHGLPIFMELEADAITPPQSDTIAMVGAVFTVS